MADAEALFLVHDQQAQILERHVLLQQLVGADEHIHLPRRRAAQRVFLLLGRAEPGEHVDIDGKTAESLFRRHIVLPGQNGGRHQHRHLFAVQHTLHGGPQGHLRFTEAHVAAEQPVHGLGRFHIALDLRHAPQLVLGLGIGKRVLKLRLPRRIGGKGVAHAPLALGVQLDQVHGQLFRRRPGLGFRLLPLLAAQLVELHRRVLTAADVFADHVQLGGRDIQGVGALIGDFHIVFQGPVHFDLLDAHIPANAVVLVDHQITGVQVCKGVELLAVGGLFLLLFRRGGSLALLRLLDQQLALGENSQL